MKADRVAVLGVLATGLAVAAIFSAWWAVSLYPVCGGVTLTNEFGLWGIASFSQGSCPPNSQFITIAEDQWPGYLGSPATAAVFVASTVLSISGALAGGGMVLFSALGGSRPRLRGWALIPGTAAALLTLAPAVLVMALLPDALHRDNAATSPIVGFWGATPMPPDYVVTLSWGAALGWYALVAAGVLFLVATIIRYRELARPAPASTEGPPA